MSAILKFELGENEVVINGDTFYKNKRYRTIIVDNEVYIGGVKMSLNLFNSYFTLESKLIKNIINQCLVVNDKLVSKSKFNKEFADAVNYGRGKTKRIAVYLGNKDNQIQIRFSLDTQTKAKALSESYDFIKEIYNNDFNSIDSLGQVSFGNCGRPISYSQIRIS